jgi:hypothetical protein
VALYRWLTGEDAFATVERLHSNGQGHQLQRKRGSVGDSTGMPGLGYSCTRVLPQEFSARLRELIHLRPFANAAALPLTLSGLCGREQRNGAGCIFRKRREDASSVTVDCISSEWMYRRTAGNNLCVRRCVRPHVFARGPWISGLALAEWRNAESESLLCGYEIGLDPWDMGMLCAG